MLCTVFLCIVLCVLQHPTCGLNTRKTHVAESNFAFVRVFRKASIIHYSSYLRI